MARRWPALVAPALLVAVACAQIALAFTVRQSAWLGGGFGMFATTDVWDRRHLHAFALRPGLRRELEIPHDAAPLVKRALAFPSRGALEALARALAEASEPSADAGPLEAVEIQIFAVAFEPATLEPRGVLLRAERIAFDAAP